MDFKASLLEDLDQVFLDDDEFAEKAIIGKKEPKEVTVLIDSDMLKRMAKNNEKLADSELLFYVSFDALGYKPQVEKILYFNGKEYRVVSSNNEMGLLQIVLSRVTG